MEEKNKIELVVPISLVWKIALVAISIALVFLIRNILVLLFLAFIGVSAAQPIVNRWENKGIPRSVSASILFLGLFLALTGLIWAIVPVFVFEMKEFGQNSALYLEKIQALFPPVVESSGEIKPFLDFESLAQSLSEKFAESFGGFFSNAWSFFENIFGLAVVFSLSFYMLVKKEGIRGFLKNIVPVKNREYVFGLVDRIQSQMGRWLIGQASLVLVIFCLDYVALYFLDVPYALVLAFFGGIMEVIPYVGPILSVIPAALVALTISPFTALMVILLYIVIQQVENHIIVPLIMKKAVGLDPVIIILSLLIGATLLGFLGIVAAVPFAAALNIFLSDLWESRRTSDRVVADKK